MTTKPSANAPQVKHGVDDHYMRQKWQEKLVATREAIREVEEVVLPLRRLVEQAEDRLAMLRRSEAAFMEALDE